MNARFPAENNFPFAVLEIELKFSATDSNGDISDLRGWLAIAVIAFGGVNCIAGKRAV